MTTLADMMLEVARSVTIISEGIATAGATISLTDTNNLTEPGNYWKDGTLFLKTCTQTTMSGKVIPVLGFGENKLTFATQSATITVGDTYAVADKEYSRTELMNAVLSVLRSRDAEQYNASLTAVSGTTSYDIPAGVVGIRRVIVDGTVNQHWHVINGHLVWPTAYAPSSGTIELIYCAPQGTIAESGTIHETYSFEGIKCSSIVQLLWRKLQNIGKDDPDIMDKLNFWMKMENQAWGKARRFNPTDPRLA